MADFLDEIQREIGARLKELGPLVDEYQRLEAAQSALDGVASPPAPARAPARRAPTARRRATNGSAPAQTRRRGRPKGSGSRGNEALAVVQANPGITIPEIAEKLGIKQNYLYRVLPGLAQDGLVTKDGRGWHAKTAA